MRLPNAQLAVIRIEKLLDYSLNPLHEAGKHKARVFKSALGITADDASWLRSKILQIVLDAEAVPHGETVFGRKYVVDIGIEHDEPL